MTRAETLSKTPRTTSVPPCLGGEDIASRAATGPTGQFAHLAVPSVVKKTSGANVGAARLWPGWRSAWPARRSIAGLWNGAG